MLILTTPDTRALNLTFSQAGDVDEHAVLHINPAAVNDVPSVATVNLDVVGVDVEQVLLGDQVPCGSICVIVDVFGAIECITYPLQSVVCNLNVEVIIPRHDLAVPPPAQESTMGNPSLGAVAIHCGEVASNKVAKDEAMLFVGDFVLEIATVVMAKLEISTGFPEVLWCLFLFARD